MSPTTEPGGMRLPSTTTSGPASSSASAEAGGAGAGRDGGAVCAANGLASDPNANAVMPIVITRNAHAFRCRPKIRLGPRLRRLNANCRRNVPIMLRRSAYGTPRMDQTLVAAYLRRLDRSLTKRDERRNPYGQCAMGLTGPASTSIFLNGLMWICGRAAFPIARRI